jgi:hypothetical protein
MSQEEKLKIAEFADKNESGSEEMLIWGILEYIKKLELDKNEDLVHAITNLSLISLKKLAIDLERPDQASDNDNLTAEQLKYALQQLISLDFVLSFDTAVDDQHLLATDLREFVKRIVPAVQRNPQLAYYVNQCKFLRELIPAAEKISKNSAAFNTAKAFCNFIFKLLGEIILALIAILAVLYATSLPVYIIIYYGASLIPNQISSAQFWSIPQLIGAAAIFVLFVAKKFIYWLIASLYNGQPMENKLWSFFSKLFSPLTFIFIVMPTYFWVQLFSRYPAHRSNIAANLYDHADADDLLAIASIVFENFNFLTVIKQKTPFYLNLSELTEVYQQLPAEMRLDKIIMREKKLAVEERWLQAQLDQLNLEVSADAETENKEEKQLPSSLDAEESHNKEEDSGKKLFLSSRLQEVREERAMIVTKFGNALQSTALPFASLTVRSHVMQIFQDRHDIVMAASAELNEYIRKKDTDNLRNIEFSKEPMPVLADVATSATPLLSGATTSVYTGISRMMGKARAAGYGAVSSSEESMLDAPDEKRTSQSVGSQGRAAVRFIGNAAQPVSPTNCVTPFQGSVNSHEL